MHVGFASSTYCSVYTAPNAFTLRKTFIGDRCARATDRSISVFTGGCGTVSSTAHASAKPGII